MQIYTYSTLKASKKHTYSNFINIDLYQLQEVNIKNRFIYSNIKLNKY